MCVIDINSTVTRSRIRGVTLNVTWVKITHAHTTDLKTIILVFSLVFSVINKNR